MAAWVIRHGERGEFEEQALEYDIANPGWDEPDLSDARDKEAIRRIIRELFPERSNQQIGVYAGHMWAFLKEMQRGDLVVMPRKGKASIAVGELLGEYDYIANYIPSQGNEASKGAHTRSVQWLNKEISRRSLPRQLESTLNRPPTIYRLHGSAEEQIRAIAGGSTANPWDEFFRRAKVYVDTGKLEKEEIAYKLEIAKKLEEARLSVLSDEGEWPGQVMDALRNKGGEHGPGNLINWRALQGINTWFSSSPSNALDALRTIWTKDDISVDQRIRGFANLFPSTAIRGSGTRANVISSLLMGLDVKRLPPFRITESNRAYDLTDYGRPDSGVDEATVYAHFLHFLDTFINEAAERGLTFRHRLDAQSVMWGVVGWSRR